jgi:uncharacterized membrane protein YphA (DoxX/SURF4 family)
VTRLIRIATASVWIVFGFLFKVMGLVPRHRLIVAAVLGEAAAGPVTLMIGGAETLMGLWILSGFRPRTCAAAQTLAIVSMNALELSLARNRLLAPLPMVCANTVFLAAGWYCALKAVPRKRVS